MQIMKIFKLIFDVLIIIASFFAIHSVYTGIIQKDIIYFGFTIMFLITVILSIICRKIIKTF